MGKRVRKQPTLYDPQDVPARLWKSDEFPLPRRDSRGSDDSPNDEEEEGSNGPSGSDADSMGNAELEGEDDDDDPDDEAPDVRRGREAAVWCNFCLDDPGIEVRAQNLVNSFVRHRF
jgi:hypothetical protein